MACKDYHDHGADEGFRRVIDYEGGGWSVATKARRRPKTLSPTISCLPATTAPAPPAPRYAPQGPCTATRLGLIWPDHHQMHRMRHTAPWPAPTMRRPSTKTLKRSSKCDGCRERHRRGVRPPSAWRPAPCALSDFGEKGDICTSATPNGWDEVRGDILPLPSEESATGPNLFIRPCPGCCPEAARAALVKPQGARPMTSGLDNLSLGAVHRPGALQAS